MYDFLRHRPTFIKPRGITLDPFFLFYTTEDDTVELQRISEDQFARIIECPGNRARRFDSTSKDKRRGRHERGDHSDEFDRTDVVDLRGTLRRSPLVAPSLAVLVLVAVIEFQLCRSTVEAPYMAVVPFLVIQPRTCPSPPLTRYKRGGYLCLEWYRRALSTEIQCTGIRFTASSTLSARLVSFILRLRTSRSCPEFLITRRLFTKVSSGYLLLRS